MIDDLNRVPLCLGRVKGISATFGAEWQEASERDDAMVDVRC